MSKDEFKPKITKAKAREVANNLYYRTSDFKLVTKEKHLVKNIMKHGLRYKEEYNQLIKLATRLNLI